MFAFMLAFLIRIRPGNDGLNRRRNLAFRSELFFPSRRGRAELEIVNWSLLLGAAAWQAAVLP
jgi:hypothetical protein